MIKLNNAFWFIIAFIIAFINAFIIVNPKSILTITMDVYSITLHSARRRRHHHRTAHFHTLQAHGGLRGSAGSDA